MPPLLPVNVSVEVGDSRSIFAPCQACNTSSHGEAAEAGRSIGCAWSADGVGVAVRVFDSRASRASASRRAFSHCAMWLRLAAALADLSFVVPVRVPQVDLWVTGSIPILASLFLRCVFQWFLISLSVRFGRCVAMADHLKQYHETKVYFEINILFSSTNIPCVPKFYVVKEGEMKWQIKKYKCTRKSFLIQYKYTGYHFFSLLICKLSLSGWQQSSLSRKRADKIHKPKDHFVTIWS
uniref:Uncharacterized protein n=1 Tax=Zea mays TaxID=4577 RepID=A0A804NR56_MAIZE